MAHHRNEYLILKKSGHAAFMKGTYR